MRKLFLPIFLLIMSSLAGEETVLSLRECIQLGLEKNYALRIVRNQEEISKNNLTLGNAGFLPTLDLALDYSGSHLNTKSEMTDGSTSSNNNVNNSTIDAGLTFNWTVFDGLKMQASYAKLKELQQMGELQTRLAVEKLVAEIVSEYNNHIYQLLRLKNLKATVDLSEERVRIVEARYQIGTASLLDLNQAKVDLNTDISKLISQRETLLYSTANMNKLLANEEVYDDFMLADSVMHLEYLPYYDSLLMKTMRSNADILLAAKNARLSELDKKAIQSRNFPYLKFKAGYDDRLDRYGTGLTRQTQSYGLNYGVTLGMNLFDGLNTNREMKNIRMEMKNRKLEQEDIRLNLVTALSNLHTSHKNNGLLYELEQQNLIVAREYYEAAIDKYKLGTLSGIELREAQQKLSDAEERLLSSEYNIKLCEISLKQLSGDILDYLDFKE